MLDYGAPTRISKETFLAELVEGLAAVLVSALGADMATSCISDIGTAVGARVDRDIKRLRGGPGSVSPDDFRSITETLLKNLYTDARVIESFDDRLVVEVLGSLFGHILVQDHDFAEIALSMIGALAALNFGYAKVCTSDQGTREGQTVRRITVYMHDAPEVAAVPGDEFYPEVVAAFSDVRTHLRVVEENRRIRERLQESAVEYRERHRQISSIAAVATNVSQSLDAQEMLQYGLTMLLDAVGVEVGAIFRLDDEQDCLRPSNQVGISPQDAEQILFDHVLPHEVGAGHPAWQSVLSASRHSPPDWRHDDFQCFASAPLQNKGRSFGIVLVLARLRRNFAPIELELVELIANELGIGVESVRLYDHLARQVDRLEGLRDISTRLSRCDTLDQLLDVVADGVINSLGFDRVGLFLLNETGDYLERVRGVDERGSIIKDEPLRIQLLPQCGTLAQSVLEKRPLHVLDLEHEPGLMLTPDEASGLSNLRISAFARVPLIAEGNVVGAISVDNLLRKKPIRHEELDMLSIFGNHVAYAIDSVRFTEALQRSREKLQNALNELRQVDQVRSEFVSMISHELRSPLHKIRNAAALLLDQETDPQQARFARLIVKSTDYLAGLVNNLLAQSRIEQGLLCVSAQPVALLPLIEETIHEMRASTVPPEQDLRVDVPADLQALAEPPYLRLILSNLLSNAIKASARNGVINIRAWANGEFVEVSVQDYGAGISAERQARIFDRFSSFAHEPIDESSRGVGLGLHICRSLVDAHGGRIQVTSSQGHGSEFTFTLPRVQPRATGRD